MDEKKKKIWKRVLLILFVLLNVGIIAWTALSEFADSENAANLADVQIKWWLLVPAVLMFVLAAVAEIYKYEMLLVRTKAVPSGASRREVWKLAQRTVLLGRYYDNVTPAAVGGQPFQMYYMHRSGVKGGYSVVIPLIGMITDQIGFVAIGVVAILVGSLTHSIWSPAIAAVGWVGLLISSVFPIVIMAATFLPKTTEEVMTLGIKFLHKIHLIKDREAALKKATEKVRQYADGIRTILKEKGLFIRTLGLGVVYYGALTMIPYFVLSAFGAEIGMFASFATTAAVSAAVYFVPTPGNAGAAEGVFYSVFSVLPVAGYVFWAMLIWRILVYYMWLVLGGLTQLKIYVEDKTMLKTWNRDVSRLGDEAARRLGQAAMEREADNKNPG